MFLLRPKSKIFACNDLNDKRKKYCYYTSFGFLWHLRCACPDSYRGQDNHFICGICGSFSFRLLSQTKSTRALYIRYDEYIAIMQTYFRTINSFEILAQEYFLNDFSSLHLRKFRGYYFFFSACGGHDV